MQNKTSQDQMLRFVVYALGATLFQIGADCRPGHKADFWWNVTNIWQDSDRDHDHPSRPTITGLPRFPGIPHFTWRPGRHSGRRTYTPEPELTAPASLSSPLIVPISPTSITSTAEDVSTVSSRHTSIITTIAAPAFTSGDESSSAGFISLPDFTLIRGTLTSRLTRTRTRTITPGSVPLSEVFPIESNILDADSALTSGLSLALSGFLTSSPGDGTEPTVGLTPIAVSSSFSTSIPAPLSTLVPAVITTSFPTSIPTSMASIALGSSAILTSSTSASTPLATSRTAVTRSGFVNGAYFVNW